MTWEKKDNRLHKEFTFNDFKSALSFVNKVGDLAEAMQHHPDITFGWGYVRVDLTTHSEKTVTDKDHELAKKIDALT